MIVTRQRPKRRQLHKVLLPLLAIIFLAAAFTLPASRNVIYNGPLAPDWRVAGSAFASAAKPFAFVTLKKELSQRDRTISQLQSQIAANKTQLAARDRQISALQSQVAQVMQQNASAPLKNRAKPLTAPAAGTLAASGSDLAANASPDMRRTANYWASMDAEAASKLVQRQPVAYAARIFALMPADSVGQILDNLPASYAAALTQDHPELRR